MPYSDDVGKLFFFRFNLNGYIFWMRINFSKNFVIRRLKKDIIEGDVNELSEILKSNHHYSIHHSYHILHKTGKHCESKFLRKELSQVWAPIWFLTCYVFISGSLLIQLSVIKLQVHREEESRFSSSCFRFNVSRHLLNPAQLTKNFTSCFHWKSRQFTQKSFPRTINGSQEG